MFILTYCLRLILKGGVNAPTNAERANVTLCVKRKSLVVAEENNLGMISYIIYIYMKFTRKNRRNKKNRHNKKFGGEQDSEIIVGEKPSKWSEFDVEYIQRTDITKSIKNHVINEAELEAFKNIFFLFYKRFAATKDIKVILNNFENGLIMSQETEESKNVINGVIALTNEVWSKINKFVTDVLIHNYFTPLNGTVTTIQTYQDTVAAIDNLSGLFVFLEKPVNEFNEKKRQCENKSADECHSPCRVATKLNRFGQTRKTCKP
jgi:hypothetical protein